MEEPRKNQRWVSLRTAAQKMLRKRSLPQGATLILNNFLRSFSQLTNMSSKRLTGESSTSAERIVEQCQPQAATSAGDCMKRQKRRFKNEENDATALHKTAY